MAELLSPDDLLSLEEYTSVRDEFRRKIMVHKRSRRVLLGANCTAHIENRDTMRYQVLEMLRAEGTWDKPEAVDEELQAYNPLISQPDMLSVTFMFEYPDEEDRKSELPKLVGIDQHVWFQVGDNAPILGQFDAGQIDEAKVSSVQFVKFPITSDQRASAEDPNTVLRFVIDHPHYQAKSVLGEDVRRAIVEDLTP